MTMWTSSWNVYESYRVDEDEDGDGNRNGEWEKLGNTIQKNLCVARTCVENRV